MKQIMTGSNQTNNEDTSSIIGTIITNGLLSHDEDKDDEYDTRTKEEEQKQLGINLDKWRGKHFGKGNDDVYEVEDEITEELLAFHR